MSERLPDTCKVGGVVPMPKGLMPEPGEVLRPLDDIRRSLARELRLATEGPNPTPSDTYRWPRLSLFRIRAFWGHSRRATGVADNG